MFDKQLTKLAHNHTTIFHLVQGERVFLGTTPYEIIDFAEGGMGRVLFMCRDDANSPEILTATLRKNMAVKCLRPDRFSQEALAMYFRELKIWAGLDHPHIVKLSEIIDAGPDGLVAAMDWRKSLQEILNKNGPIQVSTAINLIGDVAEGLRYAHQKGILHLDLKPGNILAVETLTKGTRYQVSDWGLASLQHAQFREMALDDPELLKSLRGGTLPYMAPERLKGGASNIGWDMFSLGIIFAELLTGKLPFSDAQRIAHSYQRREYHTILRKQLERPGIPPPITKLILRMSSFQPRDRPRSYDDLRNDLISATRKARKHLPKEESNKKEPDLDAEIDRWMKEASVRRTLGITKLQMVAAQIKNLQAVGREADAKKAAVDHLEELYREWKTNPADTTPLSILRLAAINLRVLDEGKQYIKRVIAHNENTHYTDLTLVYFFLGLIYHQQHVDPTKELWAYQSGAEAIPPPNCPMPATPFHKAMCHHFASFAALRAAVTTGDGNYQQRKAWHQARAKALAPDENWDDPRLLLKI